MLHRLRRARWLAAVGAVAGAAAAVAFVVHRAEDLPHEELHWPDPSVELIAPERELPATWTMKRVYIDAGHGAEDNTGNRSAFCVDEQDFTLQISERLAEALRGQGGFEVRVSRSGAAIVGYRERVAQAEEWKADVFVSIHSDVRGTLSTWEPTAGQTCPRAVGHEGYAVLWSDEDGKALNDARLTLARAVGHRLSEIGLPAYEGDYNGLYDKDGQAGVFVDRHAPGERIFVLHAPSMPSVIVETHNAVNAAEARRWEEDDVIDAFVAAVRAGLIDALATAGTAEGSTNESEGEESPS